MSKKIKPKKFKRGTVVVHDPSSFNPKFWNGLSEKEKLEYYGPLGYGQKKPKLFVFLTDIKTADGRDSGHCVLVSLSDQKVETMRHTCEFRKATDEEF